MISKCSFIIMCLLLKDAAGGSVEVLAGAGSEAVLPCKTSPQTVSPAVTWSNSKGSVWKMQRNGLQFWSRSSASRVRCPHTQFPRGDYNLHIQSVTERDAGSYFCTLELENTRRPVRTQVTLRIIQMSIVPAAPVTGQSVSIVCSVSEGGEASRTTRARWMLNGSGYGADGTDSGRRLRGGHMALRVKASERLRGNWTCAVQSGGSEGRATARLELQGIIQPPSDHTQIYAAVGSAVTLPCVFSKGLTLSNALWERLQPKSTSKPSTENLPPAFSRPSPLVSTQDQTVSLEEVSFEDAGGYRCSATAQGQRMERIVQLVTAKVEVEVAVQLTCRLSNSSSITEYEWIHTTSGPNGSEFTAPVQKGRTVTLGQTSRGVWTCRFYGRQGLLGNVTHHIHHMEGQREDASVRVPHGAVLLLAGLSLLLLILLIILNQMCKNYQRSKRVLQFPALETILHNKSVMQEMREKSQTQK